MHEVEIVAIAPALPEATVLQLAPDEVPPCLVRAKRPVLPHARSLVAVATIVGSDCASLRRSGVGREGPARADDLHAPPAALGDARPAPPGWPPLRLFLACSPVGARRCRSFAWNTRTYRLEPEADAELAAFQAVILDQDHPIAESQRPEELPVDLSAELHIAGPDRASITYRRRLAMLSELPAVPERP